MESTTMLTIGFSKGMKADSFDTIESFRMGTERNKSQKNAQIAAKFKEKGFKVYTVEPIAAPKKKGKRGRPSSTMSQLINSRFDKGMTSQEIAKDLKLSLSKVSSTLAWRKGKLAAIKARLKA